MCNTCLLVVHMDIAPHPKRPSSVITNLVYLTTARLKYYVTRDVLLTTKCNAILSTLQIYLYTFSCVRQLLHFVPGTKYFNFENYLVWKEFVISLII